MANCLMPSSPRIRTYNPIMLNSLKNNMERKALWGIGILSVALFISSFFWSNTPIEKTDFPWHIEHPTPGGLRIFGLTMGQSNTADADKLFTEEAEPSLFKSATGDLVMEMFFEEVRPAGLKAKLVMVIGVSDSDIHAIYERGARMSSTGSGKKITLAPDDLVRVRKMPIVSLTYMPSIKLDDDILLKRFGQPAQRVKEQKTGTIHWLYPQHGLDIALGGAQKPVLQYIAPKDFDKLSRPLLSQGELIVGK